MISPISIINYLNSTPSVFLKPTKVKKLDVVFNSLNLDFWSFVAQRSSYLTAWYKGAEKVSVNTICNSDEWLPSLMNNGVAIIPNFLTASDFATLKYAISPDWLQKIKPRSYGTGVLAHYNKLPPKLVNYFDDFIRSALYSLWGFQYKGDISASIQHLILAAGKEDVNDPNTYLHIDRFLPVVKIFYYPHEVKDDGSPFGYVLGSHNINIAYKESIKKSFNILYEESNKPFGLPEYPNHKESRLTVPANSLVVAAVHGLHRRIPFSHFVEIDRYRTSIRFLFYGQVTKSRLIRSALHI